MKDQSNKEFLDSLTSKEYKDVIVGATRVIMENNKVSDYSKSENSNRVYNAEGKQIVGITNRVIDITLDNRKCYCNINPHLALSKEKDSEFDLCLIGDTYKSNILVSDLYRQLHLLRKLSSTPCPLVLYTSYFNEKDWVKSIKLPVKKHFATPVSKVRKLNLKDLKESKRIFYHNYLVPLFMKEQKRFVVDEHNSSTLDLLLRYFVRSESKLNISKGILLHGRPGSGKSSLMRALSKFTKDFELDSSFSFSSMEELHKRASSKGYNFADKYKGLDLCIDEFAAQRYMKTYFYKQEIHVFSSLIENRWSRYEKVDNQLTHATSNINLAVRNEKLLTHYSGMDRELSRIKGMFNIVSLTGIDRRI